MASRKLSWCPKHKEILISLDHPQTPRPSNNCVDRLGLESINGRIIVRRIDIGRVTAQMRYCHPKKVSLQVTRYGRPLAQVENYATILIPCEFDPYLSGLFLNIVVFLSYYVC